MPNTTTDPNTSTVNTYVANSTSTEDRELDNILSSGEIGIINIGGVLPEHKALTEGELQTSLNSGSLTSIYLGGTSLDNKVITAGEALIEAELQPILSSGTITDIYIGGTDPDNKVAVAGDLTQLPAIDEITFIGKPDPTGAEGTIFYDSIKKTLSVVSDIVGTTLNVGQETYVRVYNDTGATILNGDAVRNLGVFNNIPTLALSLADTYTNAHIMGMATSDISNGSYGYITTFGTVDGVVINQDGNTWVTGDDLYLSETIPGGLTTVVPKIASSAGRLLTIDGATGTIFSYPQSLIVLPSIAGSLKRIISTSAPTATYTNLTNYIDSNGTAGIVSDNNTGIFTIENSGTYSTSFSISFSGLTGSNSGSIIGVQLYDITTSTVLFQYNIIVGRDDTVSSGSFITQDILEDNHQLVIRYAEVSGGVGTNVSIDSVAFAVSSILLR